MMLHRHFNEDAAKKQEEASRRNGGREEFVSEVFPPDDREATEAKKRGRSRKAE